MKKSAWILIAAGARSPVQARRPEHPSKAGPVHHQAALDTGVPFRFQRGG